MQVLETASSVRPGIAEAFTNLGNQTQIKGLLRLARFERILAIVCIGIPVVLIMVEGKALTSISAHYEMAGAMSRENHWFYFPLTVAAMMFVFNGIVRKRHWYNLFLGLMLIGVILFNEDDFDLIHNIFAIAFFGGNFLAILIFSRNSPIPGLSGRGFKWIFLVVIIVAMLGHRPFGWYSLFVAEWISLGAIALHFFFDSWRGSRYQAEPGIRQGDYDDVTVPLLRATAGESQS